MQVAVLWSLIALLLFSSGAVLLRQRQLLDAAHGRERLLERQLTHACGFALAGQLGAASAGHLRQSLEAILSRAGAAQVFATAGAAHELQQALSDLCANALGARDGARQLLALLQPGETVSEAFDINAIAADAVRLCEPGARQRGMELVLQPCPGGVGTAGERRQLVLALSHLLVNALDAMDASEPAQRRVVISTHADGRGAEVRVSDRGHGLGGRAPEMLFAPCYTTRQGHMGLGLPVARRIVEAHGGRIDVRRRAGGGAVFSLTLPVRAASPVAVEAEAATRSPSFTSSIAVHP